MSQASASSICRACWIWASRAPTSCSARNINGAAETVQFVFGNADGAMAALANDTDSSSRRSTCALPRQQRNPVAVLERLHPAVHRGRQFQVPGELLGRPVPGDADVSQPRRQPELLEDLQRREVLPVGDAGFKRGRGDGRRRRSHPVHFTWNAPTAAWCTA